MNNSFWSGTAAPASFPVLEGELETDVVIIGGGITGITAAKLLSEAGKRVVVVEAHSAGLGTTGHSTGNLHTAVDETLHSVRKKWNDETLRSVVQSRQETIDAIERTIEEMNIPCGFARRPHYQFPTESSHAEEMENELEAALAGGLSASITDDFPLDFGLGRALRIDQQAQFHPLEYVRGLAKGIESDTCRIFENSKAVDIDAADNKVITLNGSVRAEHVLLATHTPKGFHLVQTELGPYREYAIAARLEDGRYPVGIFWSLEDTHHSIRSYDFDGTQYLIVVGEKHKVGQHDNEDDYYEKLEDYTRLHFNVRSIDYRWSGQHYKPADMLPFIGKSGTSKNLYLATGFSTSGLLYGPLAARIITDDILGRENPWADTYRANRFTPIKSAAEFVKENANVAGQMVRDRLKRADVEALADVAPGEGKLVDLNGSKVAVHRNDRGEWTALSPVCPHMGCIVHWNRFETSWDCPCHGSRFGTDGEVLEGPSIDGLKRRDIED